MTDVLYFSGAMDSNGEIRFVRVEKKEDVDIPSRVSSVISKPKDAQVTDPTLAAFHEPKADDPQCQGDG